MRWFKNLKKWQQGGLIGGAAGLLFSLLLSIFFLFTPLQTYLGDWLMWAYLFHTWPLYAYVFSIYDILPFPYAIVLPTLIFSLTLLYAGLGSICGLLLKIKTAEWRLFSIVIFGLFIAMYFLINATMSLRALLY